MTEYESKLIELIRNHPNPERAMLIAIEIISKFIAQPELFVGIQNSLDNIKNHFLLILGDSSK